MALQWFVTGMYPNDFTYSSFIAETLKPSFVQNEGFNSTLGFQQPGKPAKCVKGTVYEVDPSVSPTDYDRYIPTLKIWRKIRPKAKEDSVSGGIITLMRDWRGNPARRYDNGQHLYMQTVGRDDIPIGALVMAHERCQV